VEGREGKGRAGEGREGQGKNDLRNHCRKFLATPLKIQAVQFQHTTFSFYVRYQLAKYTRTTSCAGEPAMTRNCNKPNSNTAGKAEYALIVENSYSYATAW